MRARWIVIGCMIGLASLAALLVLWTVRQDRNRRQVLIQARSEMEQGRYGNARAALLKLLDETPEWSEARYELGVCEQARGRLAAALEAWSRVPADSEKAGWVELRKSRIAMDQGRFAECEELLRAAAASPGTHRAEARWGLVILLRLEGRFAEAKRWLEEGFDVMTDPVETLRRLYQLDNDLYPTEGVRQALDRTTSGAANDPGVWLGRAYLAIRLGQFEEARQWLDRCQARSPDDPAVWRMRLEWAQAANLPEEAAACLPHLPAAQEPAGRVPALRAWFHSHRGDKDGERKALAELLEADPASGQALERLAELDLERGDPGSAAKLRARKREIDLLRQEYARGLSLNQPIDRAAEMAILADRLGRRFDADRWRMLAGGPGRANLPKAQPELAAPREASLGDLLADVSGPGRKVVVAKTPASDQPRKAPHFVDDAKVAGLVFVQENGGVAGKLIPPVTSSGGVGLLDFDGDGWLDVYAVQGGSFPPDPKSTTSADRLFRNRRDGTFEDVTARTGIAALARGYGHGVAVGDYNNDGRPDLFITRWRSYALYRNRGDGTFEDATAGAGLSGDRDWPTSAAFADLDGDGDLDLYVCHYMKWEEQDNRSCSDPNDPSVYNCSPLNFDPLPDHVFRNDSGRFVDVSAEAGIVDKDGRGLGVLAADLDDDGKLDLFVANDMTANLLFRNKGGFRFEEVGLASGVAGNATGAYQAGMGVACGDLDRDGRPDLAVTNFYNESTTFFRNLGKGFFADRSAAIGLAVPSRYLLGFGIALPDVDNDGWLDLITANGHVHDGRPQYPWMMPVQLLRNTGGTQFRLVDQGKLAGPPFEVPRMGRGLAAGDLDNDGRLDALVISQNEPLAYFHNVSEAGHFLTLRLEGTTSNRDGVGARVTVKAGPRELVAQRQGGGSYQSAGDPRLHFGLGSEPLADSVEVRWPSGHVDVIRQLEADSGYLLREGEKDPRPLEGWRAKPRP